MQQGKRSPVLFTGVMLGAAALAMACGSSNNNNSSNNAAATKPPAASASAAATTGTAPSPAIGAASAVATKPATTAPTTAAASPVASVAASPAAAAKPADLAADDQQKVTLNLGAEPQYLDPQISNFQQDIAIEHLLWRGLFYFDAKTNTVPALATVLPTADNGGISADGLTYTIKMKTGQKFSDGNPLTATDMEYTVKRMLDPKLGGNYASFFLDIVGAEAYNGALGTKAKPLTPSDADLQKMVDALGIKAVDPTTIQFKLTAPSGSFVTRLALWAVYPMEKAAIDKLAGAPMDAGNLIGNGPFILKEHVPKDHITLLANPNYTLGAQPFLKQITYKDIEDTTQAVNAFKNAELDATPLPAGLFQSLSSDASTKVAIQREPQPGSSGLEFNDAQKPFDNAKVRIAFDKAIDRNALAQVVYSGTGSPGNTWLPPGLPGYDKANEDILKFDVAAAKQSLADAGFPNGQGLPAIKILLSDTPTNKAFFDFMSKQLKDNLNITVQSDLVDSKTRSSRLNSKDFQFSYGGWIQDYPNADDWLPIRNTNDSNNQFNYSNPAFDAAVKTALGQSDPAKQAPLWSAAEKILLQDGQEGVLRHPELITLWSPKIKGLTTSLQDSVLFGDEFLETAYVGK
jgi:oligopeptide transport system substrate-binding protein